jgi:tryptophan 2,3-dioxygenase
MRVDALLALQKPAGELHHRDERLFQTMHQTFELWLHQVVFEVEEAMRRMDAGQPLAAARLLGRSSVILRVLTHQLLILETMTPWDFHEVRRQLGRGSGAESPGFRKVRALAPRVYPRFKALLAQRGVDLVDLYTHQEQHPDVFLLAETLTGFDMAFHTWRLDHLALVKRILGRDVKSLKGYSVHLLEKDVQEEVLFPELWKLRNTLTDLAGTSPK